MQFGIYEHAVIAIKADKVIEDIIIQFNNEDLKKDAASKEGYEYLGIFEVSDLSNERKYFYKYIKPDYFEIKAKWEHFHFNN